MKKMESGSIKTRRDELALLEEAFRRFTGAGETVTRAYNELTAKIDDLNLQLEEKNRELAQNLSEKERLSTYLSKVLESLGSAVFVVAPDQRVEMANKSAGELFGRPVKELEGQLFPQLFTGSLRPEGILQELMRENADVREREFEFHATGKELRVLRAGCHPMITAQEGSGARILILDDVTDEVLGRAQAERTGRLAAMGEMAVKIVHEVRNPMGSIELVASLLARDLGAEPEKKKMVLRIQAGIHSMNHIISNLLAFATNTRPTLRPVDITALLEDCLSYNTHLLEGQGITLVRDYHDSLPEFRGDQELLKQVFMNLILNAAQAMPDGGELTLSLRVRRLRDFHDHGRRPYVQVRVRDTGVGMAPKDSSRVFHPFFTTKERGTGLGLALSHNIIKAHNGSISVESSPGEGSVFTVNLPVEPPPRETSVVKG